MLTISKLVNILCKNNQVYDYFREHNLVDKNNALLYVGVGVRTLNTQHIHLKR